MLILFLCVYVLHVPNVPNDPSQARWVAYYGYLKALESPRLENFL